MKKIQILLACTLTAGLIQSLYASADFEMIENDFEMIEKPTEEEESVKINYANLAKNGIMKSLELTKSIIKSIPLFDKMAKDVVSVSKKEIKYSESSLPDSLKELKIMINTIIGDKDAIFISLLKAAAAKNSGNNKAKLLRIAKRLKDLGEGLNGIIDMSVNAAELRELSDTLKSQPRVEVKQEVEEMPEIEGNLDL